MYDVVNFKKTSEVSKEFRKGVTDPVVFAPQIKGGPGLINTCGVPPPSQSSVSLQASIPTPV